MLNLVVDDCRATGKGVALRNLQGKGRGATKGHTIWEGNAAQILRYSTILISVLDT
ncbi:hypothetical protein Q31b_43240 [Novipirellula aureliae]|uniref:Uncharacterized protein n=1 Tax=Novipirellula aureliae TaxID=2527966 RepID=A0A5C6DRA3_9BACT|nr:hypothetical protein Q31b_43240 [Novipirellula aureliae]